MDIYILNWNIKIVCKIVLKDSCFQWIYFEGGDIKVEIVKKWEWVSSYVVCWSFVSNFWEVGIFVVLFMQIIGYVIEKQFFEYIDISQEEVVW